jgi:hypothetical protein
MKKLALIVLLVVGLSTYAQEGKKQERQGAERERLSPEQRNQLQLKKMTLDLNLNESQQKEIAKILEEQSAKRQAEMATFKANKDKGVKPTAEERFAMKNKKLDEAIAVKAKVQKVLTPEQFKKWEDMKKENRENRKQRMEKRRDKKSAE